MVKAVLFDLDGTFADTAPDLAAALNYTRSTRQLPPLPLDVLRPQASHGSRGLLKTGFDIEPEHQDFIELRDIFLERYEQNICVHTRLFDGIQALLDSLLQQQQHWAIVTNKPHRYTMPLMQQLGLHSQAGAIVSGDSCEHPKPHPAPLLKACEDMGVAPEECIYLGDDKRDIQAAHAAGMPGVIAAYGYIDRNTDLNSWQADGRIEHPSQLLPFL